jgi:regulator of extracellular matrix RemA (YlzA/DUF370 family)
MDSNHIVLSAIQAETISHRYVAAREAERGEEEPE